MQPKATVKLTQHNNAFWKHLKKQSNYSPQFVVAQITGLNHRAVPKQVPLKARTVVWIIISIWFICKVETFYDIFPKSAEILKSNATSKPAAFYPNPSNWYPLWSCSTVQPLVSFSPSLCKLQLSQPTACSRTIHQFRQDPKCASSDQLHPPHRGSTAEQLYLLHLGVAAPADCPIQTCAHTRSIIAFARDCY